VSVNSCTLIIKVSLILAFYFTNSNGFAYLIP